MTRIAIGMPSGDLIHTDFAMSLTGMIGFMVKKCPDIEIAGIINEKTSLVHKARNTIVNEAKKLNVDKLLFLDTDMTFPANLLKELDASGEQIIGCDYMKRRPPFKNTAIMRDGKLAAYDEAGIKEVAYIATGCLLVNMSVFEKLGKPHFDTIYSPETDTFTGEDYNFCQRARLAGYKIWCDFDLSQLVGHIGATTVTKRMFVRCK